MSSFDAMIEEMSKDYVSPQALDLKMKKIKIQDKDGNQRIEDGNPYSTRSNIAKILENHPKFDTLFWDDFSMKIYWNHQALSDHDLTRIVIWIENLYHFITSEDVLKKVVLLVARNRAKNLLKEYLDSHITEETEDRLGWDGTERLKDIFTKYFGVQSIWFKDEDGNTKDLVEVYGVKYFVGAIKRALFATLEKPIKQDVVLILMGAQGIRKSSALEALALKNCWFSDEELDLTSKDAKYAIQGKLIYELAEWSGRGKNIQREKAFFSCKTDRYRPVHGTFQIEVPRRCNFAVTANRKSLLNDSTGSRRYWALVCGQVTHPDGWNGKKLPVAKLEEIAVQIWLEARYLATQDYQYWLTDTEDDERADANTEFASSHPWIYKIRYSFLSQTEITVDFVMDKLALKMSERTPKSKTIIEMCLKELGYCKKRRGERKNRRMVWVK